MEPGALAPAVHESELRLPKGSVAFLFTDIEGSTERWDRVRDAMQEAVRRHDAVMRTAIECENGVVFKTIGDAFCAAFWGVEDALAAALAAQRALAASDFGAVGGVRVRMALHVGTSDERDCDYFGPTLNRVARLLAIGHGGQVLLSGTAGGLAMDSLPPGAALRDMGEHRLKDLTVPEHVFQLVVPDLPAEFPKLKSVAVLETNLPQQLAGFYGRSEEVAAIKALLADKRLVTLFGTGGIGKTRCAQQVGAELLAEYRDGVWFADLAPLRDPSLVPNAVAALFSLQESPHRPMLDTLVEHLRNKRLLLILDNCEHLIADASSTVSALVRSCPNVKILATSREALNVGGEIVHRMPSLAVPAAVKGLDVAEALEYGAIALFDARARATNPRFAITEENVSVVGEICRRLDGIPLAIELAAARVRVLSVRQLAQRLDERFRILTGGDRTALPRQQTMRALIDWSYDSLSEAEQKIFRYVSVFAGGFDLSTATAICVDEVTDEYEVLEHLSSLVDKSLVMVEHVEDGARYRLLESTRAYALEKVTERCELDVVAARHAGAYTDRAEQHELEYETTPYRPWLASVEFDLENVRAALTWSFGTADAVLTGQRLAATLGRLLLTFGSAEARRWVKAALARVDPTTPSIVVGRLHLAEAFLASALNQFKASLAAAELALPLFRELGDIPGVADAERLAGGAMIRIGQVAEGEALLKGSLESHIAAGSRRVGGTLRDLAVARAAEGDLAAARELFGRALAAFRRNEDEGNLALTAAALAEAEFAGGDAEVAVPLAEEALEGVRAMGRDRMAAALLGNIAAYLLALNCYEESQTRAREALQLARDVEDEVSIAFALQHIAAAAVLRPHRDRRHATDDLTLAAHLTGFVDARVGALEVVREYTEQREYDLTIAALREAFSPEEIMRLMNDGRSWTLEAAIAIAMTDVVSPN